MKTIPGGYSLSAALSPATRLIPTPDLASWHAGHWGKLPRPVVTHALDVIVETVSALKDEDTLTLTTYIAAEGSVTLRNDRDVQLLDILAPLRACEPEKVKELLDKFPDFKSAAQLFPNGFDFKEISGMTVASKGPGPSGPSPNAHDDFAAQIGLVGQAVSTAAKDLPAGLDLAKHIDSATYRGQALCQIARARAGSDPVPPPMICSKRE